MKCIKYLFVLCLAALACTEDFEDINENPNEPQQARENLLLPSVMFDLSNHMVLQISNFGHVICQYGSRYQFNDLDLYGWQPDDRFWSPMYAITQNISDIEDIARSNGNANYEAIAKILKAYVFGIITDTYGDIPMSEANQGKSGLNTPSYDTQEEVYNNIITLLEEANQIIIADQTVTGDRLYAGDMNKWKRFANSLRLRYLLRISNVSDVSAEMQMIVNNPSQYPIFECNDDNAIYFYSGALPDIAPIVVPGGGRGFDYYLAIPTTHLIGVMAENNDPRLDFFISPRDCDPEDPNCVQDRLQGVTPGLSVGNIGGPENYSRRSSAMFESADIINGIFMTYSELNFILAEASEKGWITNESPKVFYDKGVSASFDQWGVEMPTNFLSDQVPYDNTTERLYEQKWLALYYSGVEAWYDWKRTSKPSFISAGPGTINDGLVPRRLLYPALEQSVNVSNYQDAAQRIGGDNINTRGWWDR